MSALPSEQREPDFDVNAAIRREIDKAFLKHGAGDGLDLPSIVAENVLPLIPVSVKIAQYDDSFRDRVRMLLKSDRQPQEPTAIKQPGKPNQRWIQNVLQKTFCVEGSLHKRLGTFTVADCLTVAEAYGERKRQNAAWERRFNKLASSMEAAGVSTAGELGPVALRELGF